MAYLTVYFYCNFFYVSVLSIVLSFLLSDAKDVEKLTERNISHIVAVYDNASPVLKVYFSQLKSREINKSRLECTSVS